MNKRLDEIAARVRAATPGEWKWDHEWKEDGYHSGAMGCLENVLWYGMDGEESIYCPNKYDAELIAHAPADLTPLLEIVRTQGEVIEDAYDYMGNFDCIKHCDPSVNFHEPECCIAQSFKIALAKVAALCDGKYDLASEKEWGAIHD